MSHEESFGIQLVDYLSISFLVFYDFIKMLYFIGSINRVTYAA